MTALPLLLTAMLAASTPPSGKSDVDDLPLVEVSATGGKASDFAVVFLSGDGGWAGLDKGVAKHLAENGVPVLGLDSLEYFWKRKEPQDAADDLARAGRHAMAAWGKQKLVLVGYSFGADVIPALVNRMPEDVRARLSALVLIGLSDTATFEVHVSSWIGGHPKGGLPVGPEVEKLTRPRIICVYGAQEQGSYCPKVKGATLVEMKGGHHFDGDYTGMAKLILEALRRR